MLAAQFACGEAAYITRESALGIAGVRGIYLGEIHVTVVAGSVRRREAPIVVHRTSSAPDPKELRHEGPLTYASVARALLEIAADATPEYVHKLINQAIRRGKLQHDQVLRTLEAHPNHPGITTLRKAYASYIPRKRSKSDLEDLGEAILKTRPQLPPFERNKYLEVGGITWELDFYNAEYRVAWDVHGGRYHEADDDRGKDDRKRAILASAHIILLSHMDWVLDNAPNSALDDLEVVLLSRGWIPRKVA